MNKRDSITGETFASKICSILDGIALDSLREENEPYAVRMVSYRTFFDLVC